MPHSADPREGEGCAGRRALGPPGLSRLPKNWSRPRRLARASGSRNEEVSMPVRIGDDE